MLRKMIVNLVNCHRLEKQLRMLVGNVINKKINRINVRISRNRSRNRNINRSNIYTRINKIRNRNTDATHNKYMQYYHQQTKLNQLNTTPILTPTPTPTPIPTQINITATNQNNHIVDPAYITPIHTAKIKIMQLVLINNTIQITMISN